MTDCDEHRGAVYPNRPDERTGNAGQSEDWK